MLVNELPESLYLVLGEALVRRSAKPTAPTKIAARDHLKRLIIIALR
jgi:hypothetical protein